MAKVKSINEHVLAMVPASVDYDYPLLAPFKSYVERWANLNPSPGPVPSPAMLFAAACTAPRGPGKQTGAVALALREGGYTVGQLRLGFDSGPAHNHTDTLVEINRKGIKQPGGIFSRTITRGGGGDSVITLTFTPAGEKWLADKLVSHGLKKPAKAPAAVKVARNANAKAAPVEPVEVQPVEVQPVEVQPVEVATTEALASLADHFNS